MALEDEDAVMKALEVTSLDGLSESKQQELVRLLPDVTPDLQERLLARYPDLRMPYAVMAVDAFEGDLKPILDANEASSRVVFAALADARRIIKGELDKADISDERWKHLMDVLRDLSRMAVDKDTENKAFIAQQANADRIAKALETFAPYIESLVRIGIQVLLTRK